MTARCWQHDGDIVVRTTHQTLRIPIRAMSLEELLGKLGGWLKPLAVPIEEVPELVGRVTKLHLDYHRKAKPEPVAEWGDDATPVEIPATRAGRRPG